MITHDKEGLTERKRGEEEQQMGQMNRLGGLSTHFSNEERKDES